MATSNEKTIWTNLMSAIGNEYGVAGLMGNLYAESALKPKNLQNSYEKSLGYTDDTYTEAVDNGTYTNFSGDSAGYGLAQWTYKTRKKNLLDYAQSKGTSIGDLGMQIDFLIKELTGDYKSTMVVLKGATSVKEASDYVLAKFENPKDQSDSVKEKRASYGQKYYDKYTMTVSAETSTETSASSSTKSSTTSNNVVKATSPAASFNKSYAGTYKVTAGSGLNIRNGAGTSYAKMVAIPKGTKVQNYGYYTKKNGVNWLYVQFTYEGVTYDGFACATYLAKV